MTRHKQSGFSLLEVMIAMAILMIVGATIVGGMIQLLRAQGTIANRTEMHTSVRSATELLLEEIGQAGRISWPAVVTMTGPVAVGTSTPTLSSTVGMFTNMLLDVDTGDNFEVVTVTAIAGSTITATFTKAHTGDRCTFIL